MKKLMVVICVALILMFTVNERENFSLLDYFSGEYTVYTSNKNEENAVDLGFCYIGDKKMSNSILGESIEVENIEPLEALKSLNAKIVKTEVLENGTTIIYAYSGLINKNVLVFNKKVNLQIAIRDDITIIGWPLIMGSF